MLDLDPVMLSLRLPALLVAITFHEFAHARVALAFGDHTAEGEGRVTLNPLAHLDPIGTIGMVIGTFGWGRPVPVSSSHLNHPRADLLVSAAGPLTNLLIALVASVLLQTLPLGVVYTAGPGPGNWLLNFLFVLMQLNLSLCFFNLIPLFPLDGSHMLANLLPVEQAYAFKRFGESYGMPILLGLIFLPSLLRIDPLRLLVGTPVQILLGILVPGSLRGLP